VRIIGAVLVGICILWTDAVPVQAADPAPRKIPKQYLAMAQHWQLAKWAGGKIVCDLYIPHTGLPTSEEISAACGPDVYWAWITTPTCPAAANNGNVSGCSGLFASLKGVEQHLFTDYVDAPPITLEVFVKNCLPGKWCSIAPALTFTGNEPLPGYEITQMHVMVSGFDNVCKGDFCRVALPLTTDRGVPIEYWAVSSYGDESEHKVFTYRNLFQSIGGDSYRVDFLGDDWSSDAPSGSLIWNIFPPLKYALQDVLEQPISFHELSTRNTYLFLAGNLIRSGMVNAIACPENGLLDNGSANPCGAQLSIAPMIEWQNRYDSQIYQAALKHNVPSRVLKAIIAQESQFWPKSDTPYELGLGMMTENGLDMLLRWNPDYYSEVCKPLLKEETCIKGYPKLTSDEQYLLKSVLLNQIGKEGEIDVLAGTIVASEIQTNQLVKNATHQSPSVVSTYEDMWKMTIANYYSGSGCLGDAMAAVAVEKNQLTWGDIAEKMPETCQKAKYYVENVLTAPASAAPSPSPSLTESQTQGGL